MENKEQLREEYKQVLLEGLGVCEGKFSALQDVFKTYKDHVRTEKIRREIQNMSLVTKKPRSNFKLPWWVLCVVFPVVLAAILVPVFIPDVSDAFFDVVEGSDCLIENNYFLSEMGRPIFQCDICKGMKQVPVVEKITQEEFINKYAYSSVPVLVKRAMENWTAVGTFSFNYFRDLYKEAESRLEKKDSTEEEQEVSGELEEGMELACQFFPYNTEFDDLMDAMNMSDERAAYLEGEKPWYFGWSNCNPYVQNELRKHYSRPYFLPKDSETVFIDWMFMGGPGRGAPIHLDTVSRPSWQAQISGSKTWTVAPVPECETVCESMNITVQQGDIFVIDTNQWYHATYVHPGPLSITIGSEFD